MSRAERRERGRRLCQVVSERIGAFASPELGGWDQAWHLVSDPSDRFLDFLRRWEASGHPDDEVALEAAGKDLIRAWYRADREFRRARSGAQHPTQTPEHQEVP